jgi:hypothetical protein
MPCSPDRVAVDGENCTLVAKLRRGESVAIVTKPGVQIPTAEPIAFAKMHVRRMWMIV